MAAPAYATNTSVAGGFKSGAQNIAVPASGANAANDLMLIIVYKEALGETVTSTNFVKPSDMSAGADEIPNSNHSLYLLLKRLTANDSGNYSVNVGGTNAWTEIVCVKFTGAITTGNPWDDLDFLASSGNVTTAPIVASTTTGTDRLLAYIATNFTGGAWTPASGMTERFDASSNITVDTLVQAASGGSGNKNATCASSGRSISWIGAIKPVPSGSNVSGTIATTFGHSFTASGTPTTLGTISTTFAFSATAVGGELPVAGSINTTFVFTGTASGTSRRPGSIATTFTFSATASGTSTTFGIINTVLPFAATATGTHYSIVAGTISTTFVFTATAIGGNPDPVAPVYDIPTSRASSRLLINEQANPQLDLAAWVGQRQGTFIFRRVLGSTGEPLGEIHPLRSPMPSLTHDTSRTIKRQLSFTLGVAESELIDPLVERVTVAMVLGGVEYPLGRYVYNDASMLKYTDKRMASVSLYDEMFIIDQQIEKTFSATQLVSATAAVNAVMEPFDFEKIIEPSPYAAVGVWNIGTNRGQILSTLATQGDYFSPWIGNDGRFHIIRALDPAITVPDFDWDTGNVVFLGSPIESNNLLNAPNRFIVISNSGDATVEPIVGRFDVPPTAPHSITNRGFVILDVTDTQAATVGQAQAMARNFALNSTIVEQREIVTAPDPRHDSYDVVHWDGVNWLEVSWSMNLSEGAGMTHVLQKLYAR